MSVKIKLAFRDANTVNNMGKCLEFLVSICASYFKCRECDDFFNCKGLLNLAEEMKEAKDE